MARIDRNKLLELCRNDESIYKELVKSIVTILPTQLNGLETIVSDLNYARYQRELHKLKGSLGTLGTKDLYTTAARLESEYQRLPSDEFKQQNYEFISELKSLIEEVKLLA
jgi:HPt (histidine-containing phosphotransfer) domain-containing protein